MTEQNMQDQWQKLNEEYEDIVFRMATFQVAQQEGAALRAEMEQLRQEASPYPTGHQLRQFQKRLARELRRQKIARARQRVAPVVNAVAVITLALVIVAATAFTTVEAVRVQVLNMMLIHKEDRATSINMTEAPQQGAGAVNEFGMHYMPSYVPEGFTIDEAVYSSPNAFGMVVYSSPKGDYVRISESSLGATIKVDSENAQREETILIEGREAFLVEKDSRFLIVWPLDDLIIKASSTISEEETLKVIASLRPVE